MPTQFQRHKKVMAGARLSGAIASVANNGGDARFNDTAHGLQPGDIITISGMTNTAYNGRKTIQDPVPNVNNFDTGDAFVVGSETDTGTWEANYIIEVFPYATYSTDTRSAAIDMGPFDDAVMYVYKTAATGDCDISIQQSPDGGTTWHNTVTDGIGSTAALVFDAAANGTYCAAITGPLGSTIAVYLNVGTSATLSVSIELCRRGS